MFQGDSYREAWGLAAFPEAQSNWLSNQRKGYFVWRILGAKKEKEEGGSDRLPAFPPCFLTHTLDAEQNAAVHPMTSIMTTVS